ncbi:MAG TPA: hypothetical protein VFV35_01495 [Acidimicrobiales bacterium]|nr:hypothetical protein [Acidimicrobiales bacterium]
MPGPDGDRRGVKFTNLDRQLFDGSEATKGDLVDYFDAVSDRILPCLRDRALSVIRVHRTDRPFMQKNLPASAPGWIRRVSSWAESSKREVTYPVCDDRRTLLWLANQRAVELHPALTTVGAPGRATHLVLDLDPPEGAPFAAVATVARLVREALGSVGLDGAVKTSGAKGLHVFVPVDASAEDAALATRALAERAAALDPAAATTAFVKDRRAGKVFVDSTRAGAATVVATYSPRIRPGVPVSFPVLWDDLDRVSPRDFTIFTAPALLEAADPWVASMPAVARLPQVLVDEGREHPAPRIEAMAEGRRRRGPAPGG